MEAEVQGLQVVAALLILTVVWLGWCVVRLEATVKKMLSAQRRELVKEAQHREEAWRDARAVAGYAINGSSAVREGHAAWEAAYMRVVQFDAHWPDVAKREGKSWAARQVAMKEKA